MRVNKAKKATEFQSSVRLYGVRVSVCLCVFSSLSHQLCVLVFIWIGKRARAAERVYISSHFVYFDMYTHSGRFSQLLSYFFFFSAHIFCANASVKFYRMVICIVFLFYNANHNQNIARGKMEEFSF